MAPPFHVIVPVTTVFPLLSKLPPNTRLPLTVRSKAPVREPEVREKLPILMLLKRLSVAPVCTTIPVPLKAVAFN